MNQVNKKNNTRLLLISFLLLLGLCTGTACKQTALITYDNPKEAVFFIGNIEDAPRGYPQQQHRHHFFSFYEQPFLVLGPYVLLIADPNFYIELDTINSGLRYFRNDIRLLVSVSGNVTDYDRPISFSVSGSGKQFAILPDKLVLPAGATTVPLPIRFVSPPTRDTSRWLLNLHLETNAFFEADRFINNSESASLASYTFGNIIPIKPNDAINNWNTYIYGEYSAAKLRAIVEANWHLTGQVINQINNYTGRKFDRLDYQFFFNYLYHRPEAPDKINQIILNTIIPNTKKYLQEQKQLDKPIYDLEGKEIFLP